MHGGEGEFRPSPSEAGGVRGADELALRVLPNRGQHDLPDQAGGLDPGDVVEEREAFTVAGGSFGDVRDDDLPERAQGRHEPLQGHGVAAGLLDGDDVEPGIHGSQASDGVPVPFLSRWARPATWGSGHPGSNVPGPDQEVRVSPGKDAGGQSRLQPVQVFGYCRRRLLSHASMQADGQLNASRRTGLGCRPEVQTP